MPDRFTTSSEASIKVTSASPRSRNVQAEYVWNDGEIFNRISWTKNQAVNYDIDQFHVFRSINGSEFELIGEIDNEDYVYDYHFDDREATSIGWYSYNVSATYKYEDCEVKSDLVSCLVTSIGESMAKPELFPNPTTGKVTVKAEGLERITVVNCLGQTLYQANADTSEATLDLAPFGKGIYFIMIQTDQNVVTQSIIVE